MPPCKLKRREEKEMRLWTSAGRVVKLKSGVEVRSGIESTALSLGERVSRPGAFISRSETGEGFRAKFCPES
jgi:hypothetical protein